jgi:hypothetical protein
MALPLNLLPPELWPSGAGCGFLLFRFGVAVLLLAVALAVPALRYRALSASLNAEIAR